MNKWEAMVCIIFMLAVFGYKAFNKYQDNQVQIQKYKAVSTGNSAINIK